MISSKFSGSAAGTGYPPVCSPPPPPPGTGVTCAYLQNAPKRWTFHPYAVGNNTCSQCQKMNTAFPVDWVSGCTWTHGIPSFLAPNGDFGWIWTLDFNANGTRLTLSAPFATEARWTNPAYPLPGGSTITVTLESHTDVCCHNWPPTIQLTPAP